MDIEVKVTGLDELERNMDGLASQVAKRDAVAAVRAGNAVLQAAVLDTAESKFRRRTGNLFRNIRTSVSVSLTRGYARARTYLGSDAFYGRFWELGYLAVGRGGRRRRGEKRGKFHRRQWMEPAAEAAAPRVIDAVVNKLKETFQ